MDPIELELPVVGVKFLDSAGEMSAGIYQGVSFCDAVRLATFGQALVVRPASISVCRWSGVILGLKQPKSAFEKSLEPRLPRTVEAVYVAPLAGFSHDIVPDAVIVRGRPAQLRELARRLGPGALSATYRGQIGRTALGVGESGLSIRVLLTHTANRLLASLKKWKRFDDIVRMAFKKESVTRAFEKMAKNALADMSICRNSTVLPYLEDGGNVSFFCTGAVIWGGNSPAHMTSGYPGRMAEAILEQVDFPGRKRS
jgi:uncharacterized protein (DUF169 family)